MLGREFSRLPMIGTRGRRGVRRAVAAVALTLTAGAGVSAVVPADALPSGLHLGAAKPPPNPTDAALQAAANDKGKLATLVGQISGQIAANRVQLAQQAAKLQLAEQVLALRVSQEQQAQAAAVQAKADVLAAAQRSSTAHQGYVRFIQAAYYDDSGAATSGGALLTSKNPSDLLARSSLIAYQSRHKAAALGEMQAAQVAKSNADARARLMRQRAEQASAAARTATSNAAALYRTFQTERANLQTSLSSQQTLLSAAQTRLATLNGQRATYLAYQEHQRELARQRAIKEAQERAAAAERAREERAQHQHHDNGGGDGGGGGGGSSSWSPPAPSGGSWTAAKGRKAVDRAMSTLGIMYAWAGGNAYGPTRGVCAGDGAWNDCNVTGYDCSGLAMYAWGQPWVHFAATQYSQAGSYHPPVGQLMPGDLLFWSYGGVSDIHHVAVYAGGGRIIEAPESGVAIRTADMYEYGPISYTTRPLT